MGQMGSATRANLATRATEQMLQAALSWTCKIAILIVVSVATFGVTRAEAAPTYSESFQQNSSYGAGSSQYNNWESFRASLPSSGVNSITVSGSRDPTGRSCANPVLAQQIADALRVSTGSTSGTPTIAIACGGFVWSVGRCNGAELSVGTNPTSCDCPISGTYTLRPTIQNPNWGGIAGNTCSASSQTLAVEINSAPTNPPSLSISKSHAGTFTQGAIASWSIQVGNTGTGATDGSTVTVTDTLPSGYTLASSSGTGWS